MDDPEQNQGYLINTVLMRLIKAGKNPGVRMLMSPEEPPAAAPAAAATVVTTPAARRVGTGQLTVEDAGDDDAVVVTERATAENLPMGRGGQWQAGSDNDSD